MENFSFSLVSASSTVVPARYTGPTFGMVMLPSGLTVLVRPMPGYAAAHVIAAARFGSIDVHFRLGEQEMTLPAGAAFLLPLGAIARYLVLTAAFFAGQLCCSLYSVLAVSMIQQRTPEQLTGKVMALTSTIAMCAQPLGQLAYGALFDLAGNEAELILLPTGLALLLLGLRPCFTNPGRVLK